MFQVMIVDDEPLSILAFRPDRWAPTASRSRTRPANGQIARAPRQHHFDLIVTDCTCPWWRRELIPAWSGSIIAAKSSSSRLRKFSYPRLSCIRLQYYLLKPVDETVMGGTSQDRRDLSSHRDRVQIGPYSFEHQYRMSAYGSHGGATLHPRPFGEPLTLLARQALQLQPVYGPPFKNETGVAFTKTQPLPLDARESTSTGRSHI